MKSRIGTKPQNPNEIFNILSQILADEFLLFNKTLNAYWNVEGTDFYEKRSFFWNQFILMERMIDRVSEHFRIMERHTPSTLKQLLQLTQFTEKEIEKYDSTSLINDLLKDHESIIKMLSESINLYEKESNHLRDINFIYTLMGKHEKMAWMLRAHFK